MARRRGDPSLPPLATDISADVVIVGGGFTGLWTAIALRQRKPDLKIVLIEAQVCGAGASGKNGGLVSGYWGSLPGIAKGLGANAALEIARAGAKAQDALRAFVQNTEVDLWWREAGLVMVSASPAQDLSIQHAAQEAARLGVPHTAQQLTPQQVQSICGASPFRGGIYYPEGATVHPGRLVRALRAHANRLGVAIFENTPMTALERGTPNRIVTPSGAIVARDVVLATNVELIKLREVAPYVTLFSSYAGMTEPAEEPLRSTRWLGDQGLTDARMFVHYFRKTPDHRVLMGSGSGPIAFGAQTTSPLLFRDQASAGRVLAGVRRLLPELARVRMAGIWGGPIDVATDRLPYFATIPRTRVHYAAGYSGHGVNPTYIGGQCLASLVLDEKDYWAQLPFCTRQRPTFPPEPLRFIGGRAIRWGILACEDAEDMERKAGLCARALATLPELFGLRVGTR
ncbi:NAD(P)/FAD-dependent oxidoreductase [Microvirga sp. M2]|uniref:NAD(P)/FAD-dependent oxidoreductase n=1 Tax=Microvirga sp. M2 TaxID=3073270 RepID=UPI0039C238E5